jgi:predicted HTH transcriptional regulator
MDLPAIPSLAALQLFPFPEGKQFEYKKSLLPIEKILPTICAFLNSDGGYLVMGIDDSSLQINGVKANPKQVDIYIGTNIDVIFHGDLIISQTNFQPPEHSQITTTVIEREPNTYVVIIAVRANENKFKLHNGDLYYRVNVSNMKVKTERVYFEHQVTTILHSQKKQLTKDYTALVNTLQNEIRTNTKTIHMLNEELQEMKYEKSLKQNYITTAIAAARTLLCCI